VDAKANDDHASERDNFHSVREAGNCPNAKTQRKEKSFHNYVEFSSG
jgi:hypothetical protein